MNRRIAARAIIVKDGKLLCLRHKPYQGFNTDYWCVPGGGLDEAESLTDAVAREVVEELGIKPVVGDLLFIQQFVHKAAEREEIEFFFRVLNVDDFDHIDLSKTSHGNEEIQTVEFIDPTKNEVRPRFLSKESLDNLSNRPVKIFNYL